MTKLLLMIGAMFVMCAKMIGAAIVFVISTVMHLVMDVIQLLLDQAGQTLTSLL